MKKKLRSLITGLLCVCLLVFVSGCDLLVSCSSLLDGILGGYEYCFKKSTRALTVGERWLVTEDEFDFDPSAPVNFKFYLSSSNPDIISVNAKTVTANAEGTATLTVTDGEKEVSCTVVVTKEVSSFYLTARDRAKRTDDYRSTDIVAVVNDGALYAEAFDIEWTVDGVEQGYTGGVFSVSPSDTPKTTTLSATLTASDGTEYTDEIRVVYFNEFSSPVTITTADETQFNKAENGEENTRAVSYELDFDLGEDNGAPAIEWQVNGEMVERDTTSFSFVPDCTTAKTYEITAFVNGVEATGENTIVTVRGENIPSDIKVDYDTFYPQVLVSWSGSGDELYLVKIEQNGLVKEYDSNISSYLFSPLQFNIFTADTKVSVKSKGNGDYLLESEYSPAVTVKKQSSTAKSYLEKEWYGGNYYISSDDEFCAIYDYFMLYREQPSSSSTKAEHTVYMGYESDYTVSRLSQIAFDRAGYTGSYDIGSSSKKTQTDTTVTFSFTFNTLSTPTKANAPNGNAFNGNAPHISSEGMQGAALYIDGIEQTAEVTTTDQLYRVVEMGYRPLPQSGSRAEEYYGYAKELINDIIDTGMSEVEIAHAIYDWILWRVSYDDEASYITDIDEAVKYSAFYIEGVLTDANYAAVCDGMSKTYSLLCNMAGLPCVRVTGYADSGGGMGGHAWNKVKVDGEWYIVDCTWGDYEASVDYEKTVGFQRVTKNFDGELASHEYFLLTDAQTSLTHQEDENTSYPRTTAIPYNFYNESESLSFSVSGKRYNAYLSDESEISEFATALAQYTASRFSSSKHSFSVAGNSVSSDFIVCEVALAPNASARIKNALNNQITGNPFYRAFNAQNIHSAVFTSGDMLVIITSKSLNII